MADLGDIIIDVLNDMYEEAEPPLNFDDLMENPDDYPDDFFNRHHLPNEKQEEIIDGYVEEYDLSTKERNQIRINAVLYYGPTGAETDDGI